jgi:putative acetyltransferase
MITVQLRPEEPADYAEVEAVQAAAFAHQPDMVLALLRDLRRSLASEPGLSLVAVDGSGRVAGHALFTRSLVDAPQRLVDVQVLSPVGVRPDVQRQGIGSALVRRGLEELAAAGVPAVFLEGDPAYYSRFGFVPGAEHGFVRPSVRIPEPGFQVALLPAYAPWMTGALVYRQEFWTHDAVGLRDT